MKKRLLAVVTALIMILGITSIAYAGDGEPGPRPRPRIACITCCITPPPCDYYDED